MLTATYQVVKAAFLGLLFLAGANSAFGQAGVFTERGLGIGAGVSSDDSDLTISGDAGYVLAPFIELGVSVSNMNEDGDEFSVRSGGPYLAIYPVRQSDEIPLSVVVSGAYSFVSLGGDFVDELEDQGVDISTNVLDASLGIFHSVDVNESVRIVPAATVGYSKLNFEASFESVSESFSEDQTFVSFSVGLGFSSSDSGEFVITPSASFYDGGSSFGLSAAFVMGN